MEIGIISIHNLKAWIIWSYIKAKKINSNNPLSSFLKGLSTCQQRFEESFLFPQLGRFVPSCKKSGGFQEMQCHFSTGYCWCVDSYGKEQLGTRTRGKPNCTLPGKKETSIWVHVHVTSGGIIEIFVDISLHIHCWAYHSCQAALSCLLSLTGEIKGILGYSLPPPTNI